MRQTYPDIFVCLFAFLQILGVIDLSLFTLVYQSKNLKGLIIIIVIKPQERIYQAKYLLLLPTVGLFLIYSKSWKNKVVQYYLSYIIRKKL